MSNMLVTVIDFICKAYLLVKKEYIDKDVFRN